MTDNNLEGEIQSSNWGGDRCPDRHVCGFVTQLLYKWLETLYAFVLLRQIIYLSLLTQITGFAITVKHSFLFFLMENPWLIYLHVEEKWKFIQNYRCAKKPERPNSTTCLWSCWSLCMRHTFVLVTQSVRSFLKGKSCIRRSYCAIEQYIFTRASYWYINHGILLIHQSNFHEKLLL